MHSIPCAVVLRAKPQLHADRHLASICLLHLSSPRLSNIPRCLLGLSVCAVCADGYTSGIGYSCSKCTSGHRAATIAVISVLLLAVVLIAVAFGVRQLRSGSARASAGGGGATAASRGLARAGSRLKRSGVAQTVKIVVVSWQIITQVSYIATRWSTQPFSGVTILLPLYVRGRST